MACPICVEYGLCCCDDPDPNLTQTPIAPQKERAKLVALLVDLAKTFLAAFMICYFWDEALALFDLFGKALLRVLKLIDAPHNLHELVSQYVKLILMFVVGTFRAMGEIERTWQEVYGEQCVPFQEYTNL